MRLFSPVICVVAKAGGFRRQVARITTCGESTNLKLAPMCEQDEARVDVHEVASALWSKYSVSCDDLEDRHLDQSIEAQVQSSTVPLATRMTATGKHFRIVRPSVTLDNLSQTVQQGSRIVKF